MNNLHANKVTLTGDFQWIRMFANRITDMRFAKHGPLGWPLVSIARILSDALTTQVRWIGVAENTAILVEFSGKSRLIGEGAVYFLKATQPPTTWAYRVPLTFNTVVAQRAKTFDFKKWSGETDTYNLSVEARIDRNRHCFLISLTFLVVRVTQSSVAVNDRTGEFGRHAPWRIEDCPASNAL